jgi:hypothetical protein
MLSSALLRNLEEAGTAVAILVETGTDEELRASRLTRAEVERQLRVMADSVTGLSGELQLAMPEIDVPGWGLVAAGLSRARAADWDTVAFAVQSLVPATLLWLRVYRASHPEWFQLHV